MTYVIEVENEIIKSNPISVDNLLSSFPGLDKDNLPEKYKPFIFSECPVAGVYEKYGDPIYILSNGSYTIDWNIISLSDEEKLEKINLHKSLPHPASWIWNESVCAWEAPIAKPDTISLYTWDESSTNWNKIEDSVTM